MPVVAIFIVLLSIGLIFLYGVAAARARLVDYAQSRTLGQAASAAAALSAAEGQEVQRQLELSAESTGGEVIVVDQGGQIVAREGSAGGFEPSQEMLREASTGGRVFEQVNGLYVAVVPIVTEGTLRGGLVLASDEPDVAYQLFLQSGLEAAGIASILGGGLMLLLAALLSRRVERLTSGARSIEGGDLSHRIEPGFNDELGELGETFNAMAGKLQNSFADLENRVAERTKQLETERARLEAVLRQMPSGVVIAEAPSGKILLSNEQAKQIRGWPLPLGVQFEEYKKHDDSFKGFHPDGRPYEPAEWPLARSLASGEEVANEEIDVVRGNGASGTIRVSSSPICDRDGRVLAGVAVFYDVTEQKQAEEALRASEERYRVVAETASDAIVMIDEESHILFVNGATEKIFGYTREEMLGQELVMLMPEHLREAHRASLRRYIDTGRRRLDWDSMQLPGLHKSGKEIPLEVSFGEFSKEGKRFFTGFIRDITERKRAEEEIRQLNAELEQRVRERTAELEQERATLDSMLENLTEGVLAADAQGRVVFANLVAQSMVGISRKEPPEELPDPWREFSLPEAVAHCFRTQKRVEARVSGEKTYLHLTLEHLPRFDDHKGGVLVVMQDLSEGLRLEANQQRFLANAAHELKTPIGTIIGASELLLTGDDEEPELRQRFLNHIHSEACRMQQLSETLLQIARTGWDLREPNLEVLCLDSAARKAAERVEPLAQSAGLKLSVEGQGARVHADAEWLEQALLVLLSNAIKYSGWGGHIRLRVSGATVAVEDEGVGISEDDLLYVFDLFHQGEDSSGGFGLGLPICKDLVQRMGGEISIDSHKGIGTTVKIELPEAETDA